MSVNIRIEMNKGLFIKDPQDSVLGRKIVKHSILLIDSYGFESFTFKKLAIEISSTEASVYRYFENKHKLLLYLVSWYWQWVSYWIDLNTHRISDSREKLKVIIDSIVYASHENPMVDFINESVLHSVVITEGDKTYFNKQVDKENEKGFFSSYKTLTEKVADVIRQINPSFKYPAALASNLFEMSNNQIYFAKHLPRLTEVNVKKKDFTEVVELLNYFVDKLLA